MCISPVASNLMHSTVTAGPNLCHTHVLPLYYAGVTGDVAAESLEQDSSTVLRACQNLEVSLQLLRQHRMAPQLQQQIMQTLEVCACYKLPTTLLQDCLPMPCFRPLPAKTPNTLIVPIRLVVDQVSA